MATGSRPAARRARLVFFSCLVSWLPPARGAETAAPAASCRDCSLVIVGVDSLRADSLLAMGATKDLVPALNRFAQSAVVFEQAVSAAPWTLPSFMSLLTGSYPFHHRVTNRYSDFNSNPMVPARLADLGPGTRTLAEILRARGWSTAGFTGGAALTGGSGFSAGFDVYDDSVAFGGFDRTVPEALDWLSKLGPKQKFFLLVHGYAARGADRFPPGFQERFRQMREDHLDGRDLHATGAERELVRSAYARGLGSMDAGLRPLLERLEDAAISSRTVVVIVSAHGEELFDHGGIEDGMTLYDELIHVPFLLRVPGQAGQKIAFQARTVDVLPTLLQILGIPRDERLIRQLDGVSLLPMLEGTDLRLDAPSETDFLLQVSLRSVRSASGWKIICDGYARGAARLFRISSDPRERHDAAGDMPDIAGLLSDHLREIFKPRTEAIIPP